MKKTVYLIVNFGGPRNLDEVGPFLKDLLTDRDVIQSKLPKPLHYLLFSRIAKKRAVQVREDYESIGGKSPIYSDTESIRELLLPHLDGPILTFHRYITATHDAFIEKMLQLDCDEIRIFPLFPQFTYATSGSIARWFDRYLPRTIVNKMRWIKSYPAHSAFIYAQKERIRTFLQEQQLKEEQTMLLFSPHGLPISFISNGDVYEDECNASVQAISKGFPKAATLVAYQSQFGKEPWIGPYTRDVCSQISKYCQGRTHIVFVPVSFTSDHIETLFEIENLYLPLIRENGLKGYRVPALNLDPLWIQAIRAILQETNLCNNQMLIRRD